MGVTGLKELREDYFNKRKEAKDDKNIEEYIKFNKLYNNITSRIYHMNHKDNEEYKQKRYESLKKSLLTNTDYYESMKEKNRIRNKSRYMSKKNI